MAHHKFNSNLDDDTVIERHHSSDFEDRDGDPEVINEIKKFCREKLDGKYDLWAVLCKDIDPFHYKEGSDHVSTGVFLGDLGTRIAKAEGMSEADSLEFYEENLRDIAADWISAVVEGDYEIAERVCAEIHKVITIRKIMSDVVLDLADKLEEDKKNGNTNAKLDAELGMKQVDEQVKLLAFRDLLNTHLDNLKTYDEKKNFLIECLVNTYPGGCKTIEHREKLVKEISEAISKVSINASDSGFLEHNWREALARLEQDSSF